MKLSLFNSHNYRDRVIFSKPYINDYVARLGSPITLSGINFIANDGIRTEQIVNYPQTLPQYCDGTESPTYLLVSNEGFATINSRWWVIGSQIQRYGQAKLSLLRDVLADFDEEIKSKPMFIRKGWVNSINDPAVLNDEDLTFNQIKKEELPIKDKSGAAWYVGYLSKDLKTDKTITATSPNIVSSGSYDNKEQYPYGIYDASNPYISEDYSDFIVNFYTQSSSLFSNTSYVQGWDRNGNAKTPWVQNGYSTNDKVNSMFAYGVLAKDSTDGVKFTGSDYRAAAYHIWSKAQQEGDWVVKARSLTKAHTTSEVASLLREQDKIYQLGSSYYKVSITAYPIKQTIVVQNGDIFARTILGYANSQGGYNTSSINSYAVRISFQTTGYVVSLTQISNATADFTIYSNRAHLNNEAFDMFAIPATTCRMIGTETYTNPALCRNMVAGIIEALPKGDSGALLYDVQLVPYCPFPDYILSDGSGEGINLSKIPNTDGTKNYQSIRIGTEDIYGLILFASSNEFRKTVFTNPITVPTTSLDFKVSAQTKKYRLVSPNYNGQFEFSAEKNNGVQGWNVDFTYKPYQPYIRVAPIFNRLYGQDFGDARGLICGGDFSITQTNDAWEQYQLQNKNYQAIFDRQITNMEVNNSVQRQLERVNLITGTLSGGITAGMAGGMISSLPGVGIGTGIAGAALSAAGGIADMKLNERLRSEAIDYAKDQFGYQLQQIQALPYSLNKVGVQNVNYKYFPFVEIYECTVEESTAFINKVQWNGMTVMRIGIIPDYLKNTADEIGTFIQAKPLRITNYTKDNEASNGIDEATYFLDVIAAELEQGVYYK